MGFFKSREERDEERVAWERQYRLEEQQAEEERIKEEDLEWQEEQKEYLQYFDADIRRGNSVVCYEIDDVDFKQAAMNYFLSKGYVCVQNAVTSTAYTVHFVLTFVKKELADSFIVSRQ